MKQPPLRLSRWWSVLAAAAVIAGAARAQESAPLHLDFGPEPEIREDADAVRQAQRQGVYGLPIRYVKIEGWWRAGLQVPLRAGEILTPENLSASMRALADLLRARENALSLRSRGEMSVIYIAPRFDTSAAIDANGNRRPEGETVGVTFRPFHVQISLVQVGDNVLPIPRSTFAALAAHVPQPVLALRPSVALSYDRAFGTAISAGVAPDLLELWPSATAAGSHHLQLRLQGTKSIEEQFYRATGGVRYSIRRDHDWLRELSLGVDLNSASEPLGAAVHDRQALLATIGAKLKVAPNTRLALDAGYRHSDEELSGRPDSIQARSHQLVGRLLLDTIPPAAGGFLRAAIWEEGAWQSSGRSDNYQRLVARLGYEKEIRIATNQTVGLELIAGGGAATSKAPAFAQFYGGNAPGQFLYDSPDAASLMRMPAGPLLRSFGENEARLRSHRGNTAGGDRFWHVNLNLTIPIRPWSRPLIPDETMNGFEDENGRPVTMKQMLKKQIDVTGRSMLTAVLKNEGLSQAEAERKARETLQEITPAAHFIIDDANVISVKPLLMFDAAGLSDRHGAGETWLASGAGLQLTLITARLEAGYLRTLSGPTFGHRGNAFVRLTFQNLF